MPPEGGERAPTLVRRPASCTRNPTGAVAVPPLRRRDAAGGARSRVAHGGAAAACPGGPDRRVRGRRPLGPDRHCPVVGSASHQDRARRVHSVQRPRVPAAHRSAPSSRVAPRPREELPGGSPGPAIRCAVAGRHPVASSRAGIPSRRWGGAASCRVVGSRCPVASWGVGVLSLGSGATSRSAARARHDSGGVTSGGTPRLSLSRARWPSGCRRPGPSLQRASDTENDTDGDSDSGDSGRGGAVGLGRRSSPSADVVPRLAPARVSPTSPPQLSRRRPLARDPRRRCST